MERDEFIRQWKEGKISNDDPDRKVRESPDNREMKELKDIISRSTELRVPQKRTKAEVWGQVTDKVESQQQPPGEEIVHVKPWLSLSIVAFLLLLIVIIVLWIR